MKETMFKEMTQEELFEVNGGEEADKERDYNIGNYGGGGSPINPWDAFIVWITETGNKVGGNEPGNHIGG